MDRDEARRFTLALRDQLWSKSSADLLARIADRGGMMAGLNPPDDTEDDEFVEVVWRALRASGLADE